MLASKFHRMRRHFVESKREDLDPHPASPFPSPIAAPTPTDRQCGVFDANEGEEVARDFRVHRPNPAPRSDPLGRLAFHGRGDIDRSAALNKEPQQYLAPQPHRLFATSFAKAGSSFQSQSLFSWRIDDFAHLEDRQEHTNDDTANHHAEEHDQQRLDQRGQTRTGWFRFLRPESRRYARASSRFYRFVHRP